jgi:ribokinase
LVDVIGIGALNWDRIIRVDRFARPGDEIVIKEVREEAGGSAANTIAGLARLGTKTEFLGRIGFDVAGENILKAFTREKVDISGIRKVEGHSGGVLSFVDDSGERTMYINSGVNDEFTLNEHEIQSLISTRLVHLSSFSGKISMEAAMEVGKIKRKGRLSFAPGFLTGKGIDYLTPLLEAASILFLNENEARSLTGLSPEDAFTVLKRFGIETIAITRGADGCFVFHKNKLIEVPGILTKAVDTTGAGDAFSAGFLYGILNNFNPRNSAKTGNFVASKSIERMGAREGLPDKDSLSAYLEENK